RRGAGAGDDRGPTVLHTMDAARRAGADAAHRARATRAAPGVTGRGGAGGRRAAAGSGALGRDAAAVPAPRAAVTAVQRPARNTAADSSGTRPIARLSRDEGREF